MTASTAPALELSTSGCLHGLWVEGPSGSLMRIHSSTPDENGWVEVDHPGMPTASGFIRGRMSVKFLKPVPKPVGSP